VAPAIPRRYVRGVRKVISLMTPAVAAAALVSCGGHDDAAPVATAPTAPSPLNIERADLGASKAYTTRHFRPALTFTTGPGPWSVEHRDTSSDLSIAADLPRVAVATIGWHRVSRVYDPVRGGVAPSDQVPLKGGFVAWLRAHPRLHVTRPHPVIVAGLDGERVDVRSTSQPPRVPPDCGKAGPRCVPLFYDGQDPLTYTRGDLGRFTVLTLPDGGELVVEQFASPRTALPKVLALTRGTLATLAVGR
jgi:hypothetical protein